MTRFLISWLLWIVAGYILGAFFTHYMSFDPRTTDWINISTYAWCLFWPVMLFFTAAKWAVIAFFIIYMARFFIGKEEFNIPE